MLSVSGVYVHGFKTVVMVQTEGLSWFRWIRRRWFAPWERRAIECNVVPRDVDPSEVLSCKFVGLVPQVRGGPDVHQGNSRLVELAVFASGLVHV
eukprot:3710220-Rhodomonas_salina.1